MSESYYNKPYHVSQLFHRNELLAKYVDKMIAFVDTSSPSKGTYHAIAMAQKHSKPVVIVTEKA